MNTLIALKKAQNIMNKEEPYDSINDAIEDMNRAIDYGIDDEEEIRQWIEDVEIQLLFGKL